MKAYHLTFKTSLHIGTGDGEDLTGLEDMLHSDTIYGAIMSRLSLLYDDNIENYYKEPPFIISSAFPFFGDMRFYPVPSGAMNSIIKNDPDKQKFWKLLNYLPEEIFVEWLKKGIINADLLIKKYSELYNTKGTLNYNIDYERPRISIDPLTGSVNEGQFFYSKDRYFKKTWGLYFIVHFIDKSFEKKFNSSLALLSEDGIGADRRTGRGNFDYTVKENLPEDIKLLAGEEKGLLLSLYFPTEEEIKYGLLRKSSYSLVKRGGYAADFKKAGLMRKTLVMLGEGSLIDSSRCSGGLNEIVLSKTGNTDYNTWRYGKGFIIGMQGDNHE